MVSTLPDLLWEKLFDEGCLWFEKRPDIDIRMLNNGKLTSQALKKERGFLIGMRTFFVRAMVGSWLLRSPSQHVKDLMKQVSNNIAAISTSRNPEFTVTPIANTITKLDKSLQQKLLLRGQVQKFNAKHGNVTRFAESLNRELRQQQRSSDNQLEFARVALHVREGDKKGEDPFYLSHRKYRDFSVYLRT